MHTKQKNEFNSSLQHLRNTRFPNEKQEKVLVVDQMCFSLMNSGIFRFALPCVFGGVENVAKLKNISES